MILKIVLIVQVCKYRSAKLSQRWLLAVDTNDNVLYLWGHAFDLSWFRLLYISPLSLLLSFDVQPLNPCKLALLADTAYLAKFQSRQMVDTSAVVEHHSSVPRVKSSHPIGNQVFLLSNHLGQR